MQKRYLYKKYKKLDSISKLKNNTILYYQIRSLEIFFFKKKNFESLRRLLSRKIKKKLNFLIFKNSNKLPIFKKPLKIRMGSGKGPFNEWLWKIQKYQKIFDISYYKNKILIFKYLNKIKKKLSFKIYITTNK